MNPPKDAGEADGGQDKDVSSNGDGVGPEPQETDGGPKDVETPGDGQITTDGEIPDGQIGPEPPESDGGFDTGPRDTGPTQDTGPTDIGPTDIGLQDIGPADIGPHDTGPFDTGSCQGSTADFEKVDGTQQVTDPLGDHTFTQTGQYHRETTCVDDSAVTSEKEFDIKLMFNAPVLDGDTGDYKVSGRGVRVAIFGKEREFQQATTGNADFVTPTGQEVGIAEGETQRINNTNIYVAMAAGDHVIVKLNGGANQSLYTGDCRLQAGIKLARIDAVNLAAVFIPVEQSMLSFPLGGTVFVNGAPYKVADIYAQNEPGFRSFSGVHLVASP